MVAIKIFFLMFCCAFALSPLALLIAWMETVEERKKQERKKFEEWFEELKELAPQYGWRRKDPDLRESDWRDYYKWGYEPCDALKEDYQYSGDMK